MGGLNIIGTVLTSSGNQEKIACRVLTETLKKYKNGNWINGDFTIENLFVTYYDLTLRQVRLTGNVMLPNMFIDMGATGGYSVLFIAWWASYVTSRNAGSPPDFIDKDLNRIQVYLMDYGLSEAYVCADNTEKVSKIVEAIGKRLGCGNLSPFSEAELLRLYKS